MCAKSLQSCLTLCNTMDCSPPGSSVHAILQARLLEWVAMPSSRRSSQPGDQTQVSWQEYWSGLSFPSPGDLPDPRLLRLLHQQVGSLPVAPLQPTHVSSNQPLHSAWWFRYTCSSMIWTHFNNPARQLQPLHPLHRGRTRTCWKLLRQRQGAGRGTLLSPPDRKSVV